MKKEFLNPKTLPDWHQYFSQVVTVATETTKTVYLSGQVGVDENNTVVGTDLDSQTEKAFNNLEIALTAAGATTRDVVKLIIYVKNYRAEFGASIGKAVDKYFPFRQLPAATWIGVQSLSKEEFLIEVDAVAVVDIKH
ncbi:MAG: RidA family protein [Ignavibacteriales bacterium]|nr:RidA family protein [Ignavibacteriales bacterium]